MPDTTIPPTTLMEYDVTLVSYSFVMYPFRKIEKFVNHVAKWKNSGEGPVPPRPHLSVLSELPRDGIRGPFIIIDEATLLRNMQGMTYRSASS
jgi:hypothetical protein